MLSLNYRNQFFRLVLLMNLVLCFIATAAAAVDANGGCNDIIVRGKVAINGFVVSKLTPGLIRVLVPLVIPCLGQVVIGCVVTRG